MWSKRLQSRCAFSRACSELTKGWKDQQPIAAQLQEEILEGFLKFYDKRLPKYKLIEQATGVGFYKTIACGWTFGVIGPKGTVTTVSKKCNPLNIRADIIKACRGSIHVEQIMSHKTFKGSEIDHCNKGGFDAIFREFVKNKNLKSMWKYVVNNDPRFKTTAIAGFATFKEPLLTEWKLFHKAHAKLQELTHEEHVHLTRERLGDC